MNFSEITLLLGVDRRHLEELRCVWPTWVRFKPEILKMPCVVFFDPDEVRPVDLAFVTEALPARLVPWTLPNTMSQREKMLTGFIHVAAAQVRTPWYLKIDSDVVAIGGGEWIRDEWFETKESGDSPVFVTSPWGYSKPRYVMDVLDDWADTVPSLAKYPRLNLPYSSKDSKIKHKRIISWLFFGRTDWTRDLSVLIGGPAARLPVPSQDSFLFYCAKRTAAHFTTVKMSNLGWAHQRLPRIRKTIKNMNSASKVPPTPKRLEETRRNPPCSEELTESRGVIYYNVGTSCAARLLVSLSSLRKFYDGPVTILSEGDESRPLCSAIALALGADFKEWDCCVPDGANRAYLAKTNYHLGTPYGTTLALDSDTLILGPVDELFPLIEKHEFCVAQQADWLSDGRRVSGRLRKWWKFFPEMIEKAVSYGPAINCGVIGFRRDAKICGDWFKHAIVGRENFIPDEVSCQMLLPGYPHFVLDGRWNRSCKYDNPEAPETRIIHYHGKKHCRHGLPFGGDKWVKQFDSVCEQNIAGIRSWAPAGDRKLKSYLDCRKAAKRSQQGALYGSPVEPLPQDREPRIVIGAGRTHYSGWLSTDKDRLDVTNKDDFQRLLKGRRASHFLAEHVWEHLTEESLVTATRLVFEFLKPGGVFRIAVPDGLNPDPDYILRVKPNGTGPAAHDHKSLFTHTTLASLLTESGFHVRKLEYWDEDANFVRNPWTSSDGHIKRSAQNDRRNRSGDLIYTSLIVDAVKPT
jgi:predicted SAM-dependent methyltransferase